MNESRVFMLNGTDVQKIVTRLEGFFRTEKGMEVQSSETTEGYVMQASQPKDGWKTLTGMRLAVTVQMTVMGNQLNVNIGEGQWSDKIGAGAIGLFVAWPLAITAGSKFCNHCGTKLITKCPNCGADITQGSAFCSECGQKL